MYIYVIYTYIYVHQNQDIYFSTSYMSVSSKPFKTHKITKSVKSINLKTN